MRAGSTTEPPAASTVEPEPAERTSEPRGEARGDRRRDEGDRGGDRDERDRPHTEVVLEDVRKPPDIARRSLDGAALAETIVEADRLGLDIGSYAVLERYQVWRRFDTFHARAH